MRVEDRFWSKVDKRGPNECWNWTAHKDDQGYGKLWLDGHSRLSHRISFFLTNGYWSEKCVCHTCDNPSCCNPIHLWEGTKADNNADMVRKGRHTKKLTEDQVREIKERYSGGGVSYRSLAKEYGITFTTIRHIVKEMYWKHLTKKGILL